MKKYITIKTILLGSIILGMLAMASCKKYLDIEADSTVSSTDAYKNFTNFQGFTEELYNCVCNVANNYWTNSFNWGEDEITSTAGTYHFIHKIDQGNFWGWQAKYDGWGSGWMEQSSWTTNILNTSDRSPQDLWHMAWYGIRKANMGLANLDKLTDATAEEKNLIKGQLLFFRGWFHHRLMEYFGGLPYIDTVISADARLPRLHYQQCADKAAADFRAAADLLPINWDNTIAGKKTLGQNGLRINKIMALGYLGKNYLWAGSPLMNYESTGSKTYNTDYCQKAAAAFTELLNYVEGGATQYSLMDFSKYSTNFYTTGQNWAMPGGTEAIFRGPYASANNSNWGTSKQYMPLIVGDGDLKFLPTANYVDNYGMANGLPIKDPTQADAESGYDPQYPWKNRDPRFYNDIIYDGVKVVQGSTTDEPNRYANLYTGGSYRNETNGSRTGYVLRKLAPITCNKYDQSWSWGSALNIYVPYMRLADVYLMYAEAAAVGYNSATGKDPNFSRTAVDAVNVIRDRAGVGHVASKFIGSPDVFLPELRRERAVELAFEGLRFNDLRRWLLLTESPYTLKKSVEFTRDASYSTSTDSKLNKVLNLKETVILERKFNYKHYWLPLKVSDCSMYPEFKQNPGW